MSVHRLTVPVPVDISDEQLAAAALGAVRQRANEEFDRLAGLLKDDLLIKLRAIQSEVNGALKEASDQTVKIVGMYRQLEKDVVAGEDRIHTKINRSMIPIAVLGVLACVAGAWAIAGGGAYAMRAEVRQLTVDINDLEKIVAAKRQELSDYTAAIDKGKARLDALNTEMDKTRIGPPIDPDRIKALEEEVKQVHGQVDAFGKIVAAKASQTTLVLPAPAAPVSTNTLGEEHTMTPPTK